MDATDPDDLLTTREASRLLHCSPETVIRHILRGTLAAARRRTPGGQYRYLVPRRAALALLEVFAGRRAEPERGVRLPGQERTRAVLARYGLA